MRGLFTALAVLTTPGCYASVKAVVFKCGYANAYVDPVGEWVSDPAGTGCSDIQFDSMPASWTKAKACECRSSRQKYCEKLYGTCPCRKSKVETFWLTNSDIKIGAANMMI